MHTYQVMPELAEEEYQALKADIAEQGVLVPVEVDEAGNILDGHHRVRACQELGITGWPQIIRQGLNEAEKRAYARKLNALRRHLTTEQKRVLIHEQLRETPEKSDNLLATLLGVTDKTVRSVREELEATSEIPKLERLVGADGRERPRQMDREPARSLVGEGPSALAVPPAAPPVSPLDIHFSSESQEWRTPAHILKRVIAVFGAIDLDPCSDSHTTPNVPATVHYTVKDNGLRQPWTGRVYMNPPYGRDINQWVEKLLAEWTSGAVTAAIALMPARTDTAWFRQLRDFPVCFLDGRLKFSDHDNSAPFPSVLFYLGRDLTRFVSAFADVGDVYRRLELPGDGLLSRAFRRVRARGSG